MVEVMKKFETIILKGKVGNHSGRIRVDAATAEKYVKEGKATRPEVKKAKKTTAKKAE